MRKLTLDLQLGRMPHLFSQAKHFNSNICITEQNRKEKGEVVLVPLKASNTIYQMMMFMNQIWKHQPLKSSIILDIIFTFT